MFGRVGDVFSWEKIFFIGHELESYQEIFAIDWDFSHLYEELEQRKVIGKENRSVYLFGQTEPQQLLIDGKRKVVVIPVIIAAVVDFPPTDRLRVESVQMGAKDRKEFTFREMKLYWSKIRSPKERITKLRSGKKKKKDGEPEIEYEDYYLRTALRKVHFKRMNRDAINYYTYSIPYIREELLGREVDVDRTVNMEIDYKGKKIEFDFQWDRVNYEFIQERIAEMHNIEKSGDLLKKIKEKAKESIEMKKQEVEKELNERKREIDELPDEYKESIKKIKVIKFYPKNEILKSLRRRSAYVGRYFPKASAILPPQD